MACTPEHVKQKVLELHPEIARKGIDLEVGLDAVAQRYVLTFRQAGQEFGIYLAQADADAALQGGPKCVDLGVQVAQALAELEDLVSPRKPG